jgi:hypothetical protein
MADRILDTGYPACTKQITKAVQTHHAWEQYKLPLIQDIMWTRVGAVQGATTQNRSAQTGALYIGCLLGYGIQEKQPNTLHAHSCFSCLSFSGLS